jgi:hypothetical protein
MKPRLLALAVLIPLLAPLAAGQAVDDAALVAAAVSPLPEEFRDGAAVLAHDASATLRAGDGAFVCLAPDPAGDRTHAACYHRSLEPFMARGRELRAEGYRAEVDSLRNEEIAAGRLAMPDHPAALYSLTGPAGALDASGEIRDARRLFVIYVPFATGEQTGLPTTPVRGAPWLMDAGTAKAHIMFAPTMGG